MEPTERYKNISDIVTSWIGLIGVLGGLYLGVFTYKKSQDQTLSDKNKATLSVVERFDSPQLVKIRKNVDVLVSNVYKKAEAKANAGALSSEQRDEVIRVYFEENITSATDGSEYYKDAASLISYFDQAWNCVELRICSAESISMMLYDTAKRVDYFFSAHVKHMQTTNPSVGKGLKAILGYKKD